MGKLSPRDLLQAVKKTWLDETEAQQLIDALLNKQAGGTGGASANSGWVESGTAKGQAGELRALQKRLDERSSALEEEVARNKSITNKMHDLRQELNQAKSQVGTRSKSHSTENIFIFNFNWK